MRTGSTPAKSRTILCMRAVPGMARGVRRRLLPQPSRLGRRRIVLTGPSLPSPLLLSGLQSCRRLVRRHQNRDRRPLWVIGLPCQTRGRSLRQADYPQLPRSTHPTTNLAATSSLLSCDDFIEYAHFQTVIDTAGASPISSMPRPARTRARRLHGPDRKSHSLHGAPTDAARLSLEMALPPGNRTPADCLRSTDRRVAGNASSPSGPDYPFRPYPLPARGRIARPSSPCPPPAFTVSAGIG